MGDGVSKAERGDREETGFNVIAPWLWGGGSPTDTVIIFDWDDTLLSTWSINIQQCDLGRLQQLEQAVEAVLNVAMRLGDTFIVTNGDGSWVQQSSHCFLPKLMPLLNRLCKVVSARAAYETLWPGDPFMWKKLAFEKVLLERPSNSHFSAGGVNLVVLGDSLAEIQAAQTATLRLRGRSSIKTLKFKDMPSVDDLLGQLRKVTQILPELVSEDSNYCRALFPRPLAPNQSYMISWASGWQVVEHQDPQAAPQPPVPMHPTASPSAIPQSNPVPMTQPPFGGVYGETSGQNAQPPPFGGVYGETSGQNAQPVFSGGYGEIYGQVPRARTGDSYGQVPSRSAPTYNARCNTIG